MYTIDLTSFMENSVVTTKTCYHISCFRVTTQKEVVWPSIVVVSLNAGNFVSGDYIFMSQECSGSLTSFIKSEICICVIILRSDMN